LFSETIERQTDRQTGKARERERERKREREGGREGGRCDRKHNGLYEPDASVMPVGIRLIFSSPSGILHGNDRIAQIIAALCIEIATSSECN